MRLERCRRTHFGKPTLNCIAERPMADINLLLCGRVATVTMCRTHKRNALSAAFAGEIAATLNEALRRNARAVILRATPACEVWSAGYDISEIPSIGEDPLTWSNPVRVLMRCIESMPVTVIALLEGAVWGAACELALACDLVFATPDVTLLVPAVRLGVAYDTSGLQALQRTLGARLLKEMLYTARAIPATRLEQLGIVNGLLPGPEIAQAVASIAESIATNAPLSIAAMKEELRLLQNACALTPSDFERLRSLRRQALNSRDATEGLEAARDKRDPDFRGV
jgi:methylmalonyl-CoA decarboxylase